MDLVKGISLINTAVQMLKDMRSEEAFQEILKESQSLSFENEENISVKRTTGRPKR